MSTKLRAVPFITKKLRWLSAPSVVGALLLVATTICIPIESAGGSNPTGNTFSGELHILLKEYPWTSDSGHWGGFSVTDTLTTEFGRRIYRNPGGLWYLDYYKTNQGRFLQPFGSFTLVQTIPSGTAGTCTATYHFHIKIVTGNIGGLRETGGVVSATLSLGLRTVATKIDNDNRGPKLEETTHPFGGDQTFIVPIQVPARYSGTELSFRATTQSDVAGGNLVAKVDGALNNR